MNFLSINSPFAKGVSKFVQMVYIGVLWFLFSIPLVTSGAATVALYEVSLKMVKDEEGYVGKSFLQAFKNCFVRSLKIWIPLGIIEIVFAVNLFYYGVFGNGKFLVQTIVFSIAFLLAMAMQIYLFFVEAKFVTTIRENIHMAWALLIRNIGWTIAFLIIHILGIIVSYFFMWFPLIFIKGIVGYMQAAIFQHIFDKLMKNGTIIVRDDKEQ